MKLNITLLSLGTILLLGTSLYADDGASLFQTKCTACHQMTHPSDSSMMCQHLFR